MSWSRQQAASFAAQGAALRRQTSGDPDCEYAGRQICVTHSAVRSHRDIAAAGFETMPDFVGRVDMAAFPWFTPKSGEELLVGGLSYKIGEIARLQHGGEWWFSLKKA